MSKILIIRFSSIGDIVLTSPVIRCLKTQMPGAEIHYATKIAYRSILENNIYIDKLHLLKEDGLNDLISDLKKHDFDYVIDLHNNLRTKIIKLRLRKKSFAFKKLNVEKFLLTNFKKNNLPDVHIVERYLDTVKTLEVFNDGEGLDYFIPQKDEIVLSKIGIKEGYIGFVLGAKFATKRLSYPKMLALCKKLKGKVVLLGGIDDKETAEKLMKDLNDTRFFNACGIYNLNQSASLVKQASQIITHDTGLMHIAAAFNKHIISVWGNTVPAFGMYPYVKEENFIIIEVKDLSCRPCSKIGYATCPKTHFNCMNQIDVNEITKALK